MSNEKKEKKKSSNIDTESFEAGRVFALLKRRDPTLYEEVVSIMESKGKDPSDIIHEAFSLYRDYEYLIGVDPRALAYAIRVVQLFQQRAIEQMALGIEYYSRLMGAGPEQVAEIVAKRLGDELKKIRESREGEKTSTVRERLVELTSNVVLKMTEMMLSMMTPYRALTQKTQEQQAKTPKIIEKEKQEQ